MKKLTRISWNRMENAEQGYIPEVLCFFRLLGLRGGDFWATSDYMKWLTDRQSEFRAVIRKKGSFVDDFWARFSEWLDDEVANNTYILYQPNGETQQGVSLKGLKKMGLTVDDRFYDIAWSGRLGNDNELECLAEKFNKEPPPGYQGRQIDVGDVVAINKAGQRSAWYRNPDGFVRLSGFCRQKWGDKAPLKENMK